MLAYFWLSTPPEIDFDATALGLSKCGNAVIAEATSGDKVRLSSGEDIQLADIKAPEYWQAPSQYKSWPYAAISKDILHEMVSGKAANFYCGNKHMNFQGTKVAHIFIENNTWLQQKLLSEGTVFFYPGALSKPAVKSLYTQEKIARESGKGIWEKGVYGPKAALDTDLKSGWFHIVRGTVISAKKVRQTIYLNFEENWREDFTIEIPAKTARAMKKAGLNPLDMEHKSVEVRGIIEWGGGPKIILTSPNRLRLLPN
ncbi:thermonuclease family protein [Kordiimonas sp. SCSIO 12603]|uniref:thermonuclease family protein n=1 Tax=Kordiimonas sp. SCSIO 12603 TaxID=2829596 RepID=UPI0021071B41|nr:thermonuclease family protein [Kordiimonas sp. SCSIO 12603]UTW59209.1 thermonuclease family protein [Kordiimonas sp. SCSIO 12603]